MITQFSAYPERDSWLHSDSLSREELQSAPAHILYDYDLLLRFMVPLLLFSVIWLRGQKCHSETSQICIRT